ncbi:TPA: ORF6N domain-containing protein [Yersinia enterocolitica]|nr:ORF6N domain-containing protein [Yersinia enterocolitica]EKN5921085.1 ORF6N domain-containing protein [Yersinia enterocolitica]EKN6368314.1 ORF6N domain-containing protein [Yersinia enterocolitica]HDW8049401.1 ORF6N domain-containing protein [Yersinia enterocolitica]HEB0976235.1 ORF6N domain-containing protein [Yersinia enterocolitica]
MSKKTELAPLAAKDLQVIEYRGQRVATTEQLAAGYGTDVNNINVNYHRNQDRFIEGKHYFDVQGDELREMKNWVSLSNAVGKRARNLRLWTERGAANHAKMLETDRAWDYFNDLTEFYFSRRDALPAPATIPDLSRLEILQLAIDSEQGRLAEKQRADKAIRTKGQISRKREASALGKLSAATRKCRVLEERLGESTKHATVKAVENVTHQKFAWHPLRKWCLENGFKPEIVPDPQYGSVKSWPREAWLAVHSINLSDVMGVTHG